MGSETGTGNETGIGNGTESGNATEIWDGPREGNETEIGREKQEETGEIIPEETMNEDDLFIYSTIFLAILLAIIYLKKNYFKKLIKK